MAVLPAPTTATRLPMPTGVSYSGWRNPCIRLTRVRNSLAETTPLSASPGMPMNFGLPAPVPTNAASKPHLGQQLRDREELADDRVQLEPHAASDSSASTSMSIVSLGRRNSGMPYLSTPPATCSASKTVTSTPPRPGRRRRPARRDPNPTTATRLPVGATPDRLVPSPAAAKSATKRSSRPTATGSRFLPTTQRRLALDLLRADPPAHRRQGVGRPSGSGRTPAGPCGPGPR